MGPVQNSRVPTPIEMPSCGAPPDEVQDAQRALNVLYAESALAVTGMMDPATTRAVVAFQRHEGLVPTGCLDPQTQFALLRAAANHDPDGPSMFGGVTAEVTGRDENANSSQTAGGVDGVLNRVTSAGAWGLGPVSMQQNQWDVFTRNLSRVDR